MRYIILIFILFFNFSYVNADAIYNLIKIPNLEVHKVDDVNGCLLYTSDAADE